LQGQYKSMKEDFKKYWLIYVIALLLGIIAGLLSGCGTVKKQTRLYESHISTVSSEEQSTGQTVKSNEAESRSFTETVSTTVSFYKPDEISDYDKILTKMRENNEPYSDIGIVKSITGSNTNRHDTQVIKTMEQSNTSVNKANKSSNEIKVEKTTLTVTQSFWDKFKWYLITGVAIALAAVFFTVKKKIFSFIPKI